MSELDPCLAPLGFDNLVSWLQPGGLELIQKVAHSLHDAALGGGRLAEIQPTEP